MKRNGNVRVVACVLATLFVAANVFANGTTFAKGKGTNDDPYVVETAEQLNQVRNNLAASYVLAKNIDLKEYASWDSIGKPSADMSDENMVSSAGFNGTFDGAGHKISNVKITKAESAMEGLFGVVNPSGVIKNLTIENATVICAQSAGAFSGMCMGTLEKLTLIGKNTISSTNCTGGIKGGCGYGVIADCTVKNATIIVTGNNNFADGRVIQCDAAECGGLIVGGQFGGSMKNCKAHGTIIAEGNEPVGLGGLGGCLEYVDSVTGCSVNVKIRAPNKAHAVGGLCGYSGTADRAKPSIITGCNAVVAMDVAGATHVGGLVGTGLYFNALETMFSISGCSVQGTINGAEAPGAAAGRAVNSTITSCKTSVKADGKKLDATIGTTNFMYESADQPQPGTKEMAAGLLTSVIGSYTELFAEINKSEYDSVWLSSCSAIVGREQAAESVKQLKSSCAGKIYGEEAVAVYGSEGGSFNCSFTNGVHTFIFNGNEISGIDANGAKVFSHVYEYSGFDEEYDYYEYKTAEKDAGEFTWFFIRTDTPGSTFHIEFRYGSDSDSLTQLVTGKYAYWMASAIPAFGNIKEYAVNSIKLFCEENLKK